MVELTEERTNELVELSMEITNILCEVLDAQAQKLSADGATKAEIVSTIITSIASMIPTFVIQACLNGQVLDEDGYNKLSAKMLETITASMVGQRPKALLLFEDFKKKMEAKDEI